MSSPRLPGPPKSRIPHGPNSTIPRVGDPDRLDPFPGDRYGQYGPTRTQGRTRRRGNDCGRIDDDPCTGFLGDRRECRDELRGLPCVWDSSRGCRADRGDGSKGRQGRHRGRGCDGRGYESNPRQDLERRFCNGMDQPSRPYPLPTFGDGGINLPHAIERGLNLCNANGPCLVFDDRRRLLDLPNPRRDVLVSYDGDRGLDLRSNRRGRSDGRFRRDDLNEKLGDKL